MVLDAASAAVGAVVGFVVGLVLVLALGHRGAPWRLDWRLTVDRGRPPQPLHGPQSDETGPGGMETPESDQGKRTER